VEEVGKSIYYNKKTRELKGRERLIKKGAAMVPIARKEMPKSRIYGQRREKRGGRWLGTAKIECCDPIKVKTDTLNSVSESTRGMR